MNKQLKNLAAAATLGFASLCAQASPVIVDVTGAHSVGLLGESGNTVLLVDIGAGSVLRSLSWDVQLEALVPSVFSEMLLSFGSSSGLDLLTVAVGEADFSSGTGSFIGGVDLTGLGVTAGSDGLLRIEFSEAFDDLVGEVDGRWLGGMLSFELAAAAVPEPGSMALVLLGLGLAGTLRRRR